MHKWHALFPNLEQTHDQIVSINQQKLSLFALVTLFTLSWYHCNHAMMEIIIISIGDIIVNETIEINIICIGGIMSMNQLR